MGKRCDFKFLLSLAFTLFLSQDNKASGCSYGRYGRNCTLCSLHCLIPTDLEGSPCDPNNGTCVAGCTKGYTGHNCTIPDRPYQSQTTETSTVTRSSVPDTTTVTRPNVPKLTTVTRSSVGLPKTTTVTRSRSTAAQTSPHEYIILGIFVLFTIGAITFCIFKLRKILWNCFSIITQRRTTQTSTGRYVNVPTDLSPAPPPATQDDDDDEHPYEILHLYESVH